MFRVLFVCTGNICRSPMAEGMLRHFIAGSGIENIHVSSAGTYAVYGNPATENAVIAMREDGIDISLHRAQMLTKEMIVSSDIVLAMEHYHLRYVKGAIIFGRKKCHLLSEFHPEQTEDEIKDPYNNDLSEYVYCKDRMKSCMELLLKHIENRIKK